MKTVRTHIRSIAALSRATAAAVALAVGMTACNNEDDVTSGADGRVPITQIIGSLSPAPSPVGKGAASGDATTRNNGTDDLTPPYGGGAGGEALTRVADAAWDAGDQIALSLHHPESGANVGDAPGYTYVTATGDGTFAPKDADNTAYYPADRSAVRVQAMYPMNSPAVSAGSGDATGTLTVSLADQSDLADIDLMTARAAGTNSAEQPAVSLTFSHRLTKLTVSVSTDEIADALGTDIATVDVTLKQVPAAVSLDVLTQAVSTGTAKADLTATAQPATGSDAYAATLIVAPTESLNGTALVIALKDAGGNDIATYTATCGNIALAAGSANTLNVSLHKTAAEITGVSITDWTDGTTATLPLTIDGISADSSSDGTGSGTAFTPTEGTLLIVANNAGTTNEAARGTYTYDTTNGWTSTAPITWDNLSQGNAYDFILRYSPAAPDAASGETDVLKSVISGMTFGSAINATGNNALKHALSKLTVKLTNNLKDAEGNAIAVTSVALTGLYQSMMAATDGEVKTGDLSTLLYGNTTGDAAGNATATGIAYSPAGTTATTGEGHIINPQAVGSDVKIVITAGGNSYTYNLGNDLEALAAGTHHRIALTLGSTGITIAGISVIDWTADDVTPDNPITIDGISTDEGNGSSNTFKPTEGNLLIVMNNAGTTTEAARATYVYNATNGWISDAPIAWDWLTQGASYDAILRYSPAAPDAASGETDVLKSVISGMTFGSAINATGNNALKHALSKLTVKLTNNLKDAEGNAIAVTSVALHGLYQSMMAATDGEVKTGDLSTLLYGNTTGDEAGNATATGIAYSVSGVSATTGEGHIINPQAVTAGSVKLVISAGGNTYTYVLNNGDNSNTQNLTALAAGTHHVLNLTLDATGIAVGTIGFEVSDWGDGGSYNGSVGLD